MSTKSIVFITGANAGLGLEIVRALAHSTTAYHIFLGGRTLTKVDDAIKTIQSEVPNSPSDFESVQVDLVDDESIEKAFQHVQKAAGKVDVLINNGGVSLDGEIAAGNKTARQAWNEMYDVNVTGTNILTTAFIPLLIKSSNPRLIFITSGTSSIEEASQGLPFTAAKPPSGWPKPPAWGYSGYRSSKAGLNMMMVEWGRILKEDKVKIWGIAPGFLATGLAGVGKEKLLAMGAKDPAFGGKFVKDVVEGARDGDVGKAIRFGGVMPW